MTYIIVFKIEFEFEMEFSYFQVMTTWMGNDKRTRARSLTFLFLQGHLVQNTERFIGFKIVTLQAHDNSWSKITSVRRTGNPGLIC